MRKRRWFGLPLRRADLSAEQLDAEIHLHLELRERQLIGSGYSPDAARAEALRRFGQLEDARSSLYRAARRRDRRMLRRGLLDAVRQDLGLAVRSLVCEPGFTIIVVLTMALGIGANAAMFGIIDRLLLRGPAHVREPDSVVRLYAKLTHPEFGESATSGFGYVMYRTLLDGAAHTFEGVSAYSVNEFILGRGAEAERILLGSATWDFFSLLGVQPQHGRFFTEQEDRPPTGENVVVLGHELWRSRFASDPGVLGKQVVLGGEAYTVVGVAPDGFTGPDLTPVRAWIPMSARSRTVTDDWPIAWDAQWLAVVARLAPGVSAEAGSEAATAALRRSYNGPPEETMAEAQLFTGPLHWNRRGREPLEASVSRWLVGVAAVVLLIACANVMNLHLARAARRRREIAMRQALGIGRTRLLAMLLTHSLLLAILGGLAALLLAGWGGAAVRAVLLPDVDWTASPLNARVLLFTAFITIATGVITGLLPAAFSARHDLTNALRTGIREGGGHRSRLRSALTVAQASLSVVLLVGAGLFLRSLDNALGLDLGLDAQQVQLVQIRWPASATTRESRRAYFDRALERVRGLPYVENAAIVVGTPFLSSFSVDLRIPGRDSVPELAGGGPYIVAVTPGYFETAGTRLLRGREFQAGEGAGSEAVTIVNETMARTLWPAEDALEQCMYIGDEDPPCARVVGVVEDARRFALREEPAMQYYIPLGQERGFGGSSLLVRPRGEFQRHTAELRAELQRLDSEGGYAHIVPLGQALDPQIRPWRLGAVLFGIFGALALLIAGVGLYSVIAYGVSQRTHELGVRMALGAQRANVWGMILRQGLLVALLGAALGCLIALGASALLESVLFEASPRDPVVFIAVLVTIFGAALLASLVPAARAMRVDPVVALRAE
jgi:predicted permease